MTPERAAGLLAAIAVLFLIWRTLRRLGRGMRSAWRQRRPWLGLGLATLEAGRAGALLLVALATEAALGLAYGSSLPPLTTWAGVGVHLAANLLVTALAAVAMEAALRALPVRR